MKAELQISVRALVEYVSRSGDLNLGFAGSKRPMEGIHGHQRVQNTRPENSAREVPVSHVVETENAILTITGRIDGIYEGPDGIIIDEIKTTYLDLGFLEKEENPLDWGQVKIYAYIYAIEHQLNQINIQLTYYQLPTEKTREIRRACSLSELELFFNSIVDKYLEWIGIAISWRLTRDASISCLDFPYPEYRPSQRDMAVSVYKTIKDRNRLFLQAATGIGKTMAVLFPAIKALGEGHGSKIFFLTARTTGRMAAESALGELERKGLRLKSLTITAKEKICPNPDKTCTGEDCRFARGYYDRVDDAVAEIIKIKDAFTREIIESVAEEYKICPFEFSLDLALWIDCIICDYNYVFDPRVYLRRFFSEKSTDYILLVDEAHNLVDRSRDMFSAELRKQVFLDLRRPLKDQLPKLYKCMGNINSWMIKARKSCRENGDFLSRKEPPDELYPRLKNFQKLAEDWLALNYKAHFRDSLLDLYFDVLGFMRISDDYSEGYVSRLKTERNDLLIKLFCIDPSHHLAATLEKFRSVIFFSATLTPPGYFKYILGCDPETQGLDLPSPFPENNFSLMVSSRISTYYRQRHHTKEEICRSIIAVVKQKKGNYLSFFPSYEYMMMIHEIFSRECPEMETLVQTPAMKEGDRDIFLGRFTVNNPQTLVGFVVMGGIFGEGIDLAGERLSGAIIVGVGLPAISPDRDLIKTYFDRLSGNGFNYAYLYPGINRILQAAGRVIRSETDRGVVLLIDERFSSKKYRTLLPGGWRPVIVHDNLSIEEQLNKFWKA